MKLIRVARLLCSLAGLALVASFVVAVGPVQSVGADTANIPVTTTIQVNGTGTTYHYGDTIPGLHDGDTLNIHVDAQSPPNAVASSIFGVDARICAGGASINNLFDFSPTQGGKCVLDALSPGSDTHTSTSTAPPNLTADLSFVVGIGSDTYETQSANFVTITCDSTHPCELALALAVPGASDYQTFALNYATAPHKPGPPTAAAATAGNGQANVSWTAPADNGGAAITSYTATSSPGGLTCTTATTGCTVTGLTNFTSYTFTVTATNAVPLTSDPSAASNSVKPLPTPPTGVGGVPGDSQVAVSWTAASPAPTNYTVTGSPGGTCTTASTTCTITGLTNGTPYTFTVTANYSGGTAVSSPSAPVTPSGPTKPGPPTNVTATAGNAQATLTWTAPVNSGGSAITSYTATSSPGGLTCTTASTGCTVTGLTNFTSYTFTVTATNVGSLTSDPSAPSNTVTLLPSKPVISTVTPGNGQVTVTWSASNPAPTNYTVTGSPGGTCTTSSLTCTITGLTNGTPYTFTVTANYGLGTVTSAASSPVTPVGPPSAPTAVGATSGNGQATVSWTAPSSTGGAAITSYTATSSPGGLTCTTSSTSCTVTGLTNFTAYTFTVTATNAASLTSPPSSASSVVTPLPSKPVISTVTPGNGQVTITWAASSPTPTNYTVTGSPGGTCTTSSTTCTITGLTNGTPYTFTVTANYPGGTTVSAASAPVTPEAPTPPDAPTNVTGAAANGSVAVSWTAPGNPGTESLKPLAAATITGYTATASPGGATCTTTGATTCTVTGLVNFTAYTFTVTATNSAGLSSSPSAESPSVTPVPTAPAITSVTPADGSVTVVWSAADPAPLSYTVTGTPSGTCTTTTATTCTITGLTDGTSYTFTVTATYDGGTVGSTPSAAVVPAVPTTSTTSTTSTTVASTSTTAAASVSGVTADVATTGSLPITGSNSGFLLELAGLCILAGTGLIVVTRRRRGASARS